MARRSKSFSALALISLTLVALGSPASAVETNSSPAPMGGTFFSVQIPNNVLNAKLFGKYSNPITLSQYKGKYVVLAPFLTSCQEICPMVSVNMLAVSKAIAKSGLGEQVKVLEVSVDSERDSASRIKAYQDLFGDSSWTIASGDQLNLKTFWKFFGAQAVKQPYSKSEMNSMPADWQTGKKNTFDIMHTDEVLIISPDQKWVWLDLGNPAVGKGNIPTKLKNFLSSQGISNIAKPEEPSWNVVAVTAALSNLLDKKIG